MQQPAPAAIPTTKAATVATFTVLPEAALQRLDVWLTTQLNALEPAGSTDAYSRARVQQLVREGFVQCDGQPAANPSRKTRGGETYRVDLPALAASTLVPENIPLEILFEDDELLVLNKPAGLAVHPSPGHETGTLVHALLWHCQAKDCLHLSGINGEARPGIVHRIDKDTSGVMVVAKSDRAHRGLARQFANHSIVREYHAIVRGLPLPAVGTIDAPIGRDPKNRLRRAVVSKVKAWLPEDRYRSAQVAAQVPTLQKHHDVADFTEDDDSTPGGKQAVTHYRLLEALPNLTQGGGRAASLVACTLETGRTHQIRVHMAHLGHPLLNDPLYGGGRRPLAGLSKRHQQAVNTALDAVPGQALHAALLGFRHPVTHEHLEFEAPLPEAMQNLLCTLQAG